VEWEGEGWRVGDEVRDREEGRGGGGMRQRLNRYDMIQAKRTKTR